MEKLNKSRFHKLLACLVVLSMIAGFFGVITPQAAYADEPVVLTVTGSGVTAAKDFTLQELKALPQFTETYSGNNSTGSHKTKTGTGPTLESVLTASGLKDDAETIKFWSNDSDDGKELNMKELLQDTRYYFPNADSEDGKKEVQAILALDLDGGRLLFGQKTVTEQNYNNFFKYLCSVNEQEGTHKGQYGKIEVIGNKPPAALTIFGDGVEQTKEFTLEELQNLTQVTNKYSTYNQFPAWKSYVDVQGPTVKSLLDLAGLKETATVITFKAYDNFIATFTKQQLLDDTRYYFPKGNEGSYEGKEEVEPILGLNKDNGGLLLGQQAPHEQTKEAFVKYMCQGGTIEVKTTPLEQWELPTATPEAGMKTPGTKVVLNHANEESDTKIYYTLDGSEPTVNSSIYNISNFNATKNLPIELNESMTIKARAIGFGKLDSAVATFKYTVEPEVFNIAGDGLNEPISYALNNLKNMTAVEKNYKYCKSGEAADITGKGVLLSTLLEKLDMINDGWKIEFTTLNGEKYDGSTVKEVNEQDYMIAYDVDGQPVEETTGDQTVNIQILRNLNDGKTPGNQLRFVSGIQLTEVEQPLNISSVKLFDVDGQPISTVANGGGYQVEAQVDHDSNTAKDALIIIQVRNGSGATATSGGKVIECVAVQMSLQPITKVTSEFTLPDHLAGKAYVDVFVWDGWDNQCALANASHNLSFKIEK